MSIFWNENDDENNNITCWFQGEKQEIQDVSMIIKK